VADPAQLAQPAPPTPEHGWQLLELSSYEPAEHDELHENVLEVYSYPEMQAVHTVADPEHVLQGEVQGEHVDVCVLAYVPAGQDDTHVLLER